MELSFKWKKILLLHFFNIATKFTIEKMAHRFGLDNVVNMIGEIALDLENNNDNVYIIELISLHHQFNLPIYLVRSHNDLNGVLEFIRFYSDKNFVEIWYYKKQHILACGRILFLNGPPNNQIIEIINGSTIRDLESGNFSLYINASRINWGWSWNIEEYSLSSHVTTINTPYQQFISEIFIEFEKKKSCVNDLSIFFRDLEIDSFTLDFLLVNDGFHLIDWDTENDIKVFDHLDTSGFSQWDNFYLNE